MSEALVKSFESDFDPARFTDDYQDQLKELIEAKLEKGDAVDTAETFGEAAEESEGGGEVLDLMEALRRSVEKNREAKATPAKKAPAKKAPAKKKASA
jgi:DNA end-binding protein Ku